MVKTMNINADVTADRELRITLPADVPLGPAEIVLVVSSAAPSAPSTLGALLNSEFFGIWGDRTDIGTDFAHDLRSRSWKRSA